LAQIRVPALLRLGTALDTPGKGIVHRDKLHQHHAHRRWLVGQWGVEVLAAGVSGDGAADLEQAAVLETPADHVNMVVLFCVLSNRPQLVCAVAVSPQAGQRRESGTGS
jgi:hypothetical protein